MIDIKLIDIKFLFRILEMETFLFDDLKGRSTKYRPINA